MFFVLFWPFSCCFVTFCGSSCHFARFTPLWLFSWTADSQGLCFTSQLDEWAEWRLNVFSVWATRLWTGLWVLKPGRVWAARCGSVEPSSQSNYWCTVFVCRARRQQVFLALITAVVCVTAAMTASCCRAATPVERTHTSCSCYIIHAPLVLAG